MKPHTHNGKDKKFSKSDPRHILMEKLSIDQDMRADQKVAAITYDAVFIQVMAKNFKPGDRVNWSLIVQEVDIYIDTSFIFSYLF